MTGAQVPGSPEDPRSAPAYVGGEAGKRLAVAFRRWEASGYDRRLAPDANPSPEQQALYDAFDRGDWDAWMHAVGWRNGDDAFLAFGEDPIHLPVYGVIGSVKRPTTLTNTPLRFPGCLRMMPYAEPVLNLKRISKGQARRWQALILTPESRLGP